MKVFCGVLAVLAGAYVVESQPPPPGGGNGGPPTGGGGGGSGGAACDQCGSSALYSEKVALDADYGFAVRQITTNGCPNHYSVCTGKQGLTGCGGVGVEGTASEAVMNSADGDGSTTISIPALPVFATSTTDIECDLGAIAIALNGVGIFGGAVDSDCNMLDPNDDTSEWTSFDMCSGHSQQQGMYHYHFPPSCLIAQAAEEQPASIEGHSPQIGWSYDGFPIYGPIGADGQLMRSATSDFCQASPDSSLCLDECGGRREQLEGLDEFFYRYYFSGETSDLATLPSSPMPSAGDYPYSIKCYVGCTAESLADGSCTSAGSGVSESYAPTALTGVTAIFDMYGDVEAAVGADSIAAQCAAEAASADTTESVSTTHHLRTTTPSADISATCAKTTCGDSTCGMLLTSTMSEIEFEKMYPDCDCSTCFTTKCDWWNC